MNQIGPWLATLAQQALAILIGGVIAVGWGKESADWLRQAIEDRRSRSIAYVDVPREVGGEAYYYVGSKAHLEERAPVQVGMYYTHTKVADQYFRYEFTPGHPIRSRSKLYLFLMTELRNDDGHILQGHLPRPSQTSWKPEKSLGQFYLDTQITKKP